MSCRRLLLLDVAWLAYGWVVTKGFKSVNVACFDLDVDGAQAEAEQLYRITRMTTDKGLTREHS